MQKFPFEHNRFILRFDPGEDVIAGLTKIATEEGWGAASFSGLGAAKHATLGYYDLSSRTYQYRDFAENLEVIGMQGNLVMVQNEVVVHAHGTFSRRDFSCIGGHVKELVVSATCEVTVKVLSGKLERSHDETTGLNVLG